MDFSFATDYFYRNIFQRDLDIILLETMNFERYAPFGNHGGNMVSVRTATILHVCRHAWPKLSLKVCSAEF